MEKVCSRCSVVKPLEDFNKKASSKDGKCEACRDCMKAVKSTAYLRDREKLLPKMKAYRDANAEKVSATKKASRLKKHDEYRARERAAYYANRENILAKTKERRLFNLEKSLAAEKQVRSRLSEKRAAAQREYYSENREARNAYGAAYSRERRKTDPLFALSHTVRRRITIALSAKGYLKTSPTREMLGCDFQELHAHLESQFKDGVTHRPYNPPGECNHERGNAKTVPLHKPAAFVGG